MEEITNHEHDIIYKKNLWMEAATVLKKENLKYALNLLNNCKNFYQPNTQANRKKWKNPNIFL